MTIYLTMISEGANALLAGGYALWTEATKRRIQALALLTLVQSSEHFVKKSFESEQSRFYVQLVFDLLPFAFFAALEAERLKAIIMGSLYFGLRRGVLFLSEDSTPLNSVDYEEIRKRSQSIFIDFYLGKCPNLNQVTIEEIWAYDREELEEQHNFIQWLFPLKSLTVFEPKAPLLNQTIIDAFKGNSELKQHLKKSFRLMLDHYGFELTEENVVKRGKHFEERKLQMVGHNQRRISRILSSLIFLGEESLARSFYENLEVLYVENSMGKSFNNSFETHWKPILT